MATTIVLPEGPLSVPATVTDHASFLRWLRSGLIPNDVAIAYLQDSVWIDSMPERAFAHNKIKTAIARVLDDLAVKQNLGVFFGDGLTYTSETEEFTTVPDGIFVTTQSLEQNKVKLAGHVRNGTETELVGVPDIVVEVVSASSVDKDTDWLMTWYWNAGITEYWLVDAQLGEPQFMLYRHRARGYQAVKATDGWFKSGVLNKAFRFAPGKVILGKQTYDFLVR